MKKIEFRTLMPPVSRLGDQLRMINERLLEVSTVALNASSVCADGSQIAPAEVHGRT